MIYSVAITTPANTLSTTPKVTTLKLTAGVIKHVAIDFPKGCYWLVGVRVYLREHQLYPTNPDAIFRSNGNMIQFDDNTSIVDPPHALDIETYNEDSKYDHTVYLYFDVEELSPTDITGWYADMYSGYVG